MQTDCTFLATTVVHTRLVECGGCRIRTRKIGAGLVSTMCFSIMLLVYLACASVLMKMKPCRQVTTVPGSSVKVVEGCALSTRTWSPNVYPTASAAITLAANASESAFSTPLDKITTTTTPLSTSTSMLHKRTQAPCTPWVPAPQSKLNGLCHIYPDTATLTAYEDCGGCVTRTLDLAPGPW